MKKVFVVGPSIGYASWIENKILVDNQNEADIVMFTGGCDINPRLYNCKPHATTWYSNDRDAYEVKAFYQVKPNQLCIGTCRGAQLFTALLGGKLVQDVSGHEGSCHLVKLVTNKFGNLLPNETLVTSIHHQMMYPYEMDPSYYDILYTSKVRMSRYYLGDGIDPDVVVEKGEPELVLYHVPNSPVCLGIQGHPEMMDPNDSFVVALNNLVNTLLICW